MGRPWPTAFGLSRIAISFKDGCEVVAGRVGNAHQPITSWHLRPNGSIALGQGHINFDAQICSADRAINSHNRMNF